METLEKPNMFDKTIKQPKTATKLSKTSKQSKLVTHPNKIKSYTESKEADCTLHLDLFKKHNPNKKCSQRYELKHLTLKSMMRSLVLHNIISSEFKEFKF